MEEYEGQSDNPVLNHTQKWLSEFVIKLNICPFAKSVFDKNKIRFKIHEHDDLLESLNTCLEFIAGFIDDDQHTTGFFIFSQGFDEFDDLLDFSDRLEWAMEDSTLDAHFQLVAFHPNFKYADSDDNSPGNFTNRSPYPMLHILNRIDVGLAIKSYPDVSSIPEINKVKLNKFDLNMLQKLIQKET